MTTLVARFPLEPLSMSSIQSGSRRQSARLQQKDDAESSRYGQHGAESPGFSHKPATRVTSGANSSRKRKNQYDEEDDGFMFARVKKKKPRSSDAVQEATVPLKPQAISPGRQKESRPAVQKPSDVAGKSRVAKTQDGESVATKRRNRMSFSTPAAKAQPKVRRSKRLSNEGETEESSPQPKAKRKGIQVGQARQKDSDTSKPTSERGVEDNKEQNASTSNGPESPQDQHSATKIALPFADTPVISRNKAMREGKQKGERRSSLGLRGRRASSLIDSGSSNALPHSEVQIPDFYKHIESDLMEPRRMRQLLTWCATRAMHPKPQGTSFEDASAKSAARVIEEELLKELTSKSELSDWFNREEIVPQLAPLPERPHPKNLQNATKIAELQERIQILRAEKEKLEALQRPPTIPASLHDKSSSQAIERSLLSESDEALMNGLDTSADLIEAITSRVQSLTSELRPAIDTFADGVHQVSQYQKAADGVAGRVLSLCAEKLAVREREGRKKALGSEEGRSPARDLSSVLRGLSKADR